MQKGVLGFDAIFKEEEMSISEQEVEQEAEAVLGEAAQSEKELDEEKLLAQVYEVLKANFRGSPLQEAPAFFLAMTAVL